MNKCNIFRVNLPNFTKIPGFMSKVSVGEQTNFTKIIKTCIFFPYIRSCIIK